MTWKETSWKTSPTSFPRFFSSGAHTQWNWFSFFHSPSDSKKFHKMLNFQFHQVNLSLSMNWWKFLIVFVCFLWIFKWYHFLIFSFKIMCYWWNWHILHIINISFRLFCPIIRITKCNFCWIEALTPLKNFIKKWWSKIWSQISKIYDFKFRGVKQNMN